MVSLNTQSLVAKKMSDSEARQVKGRSLWVDARVRLFRNKAAVTSMIILSIVGMA